MIKCRQCRREFATYSGLYYHERHKHPDKPIHQVHPDDHKSAQVIYLAPIRERVLYLISEDKKKGTGQ